MRVTSFAFLILLCSIAFAQEDTTGIKWTNDYTLSWDDFQGEEDVELSLSAVSKIAIPYTYSSDGEVDVTVTLFTVFMKHKSWYKDGKQNNVLLGHEQLHFDIAEIHRRIIVQALFNAKFTRENYDSELRKIVTDIWDNDYRKMQDSYDAETNYARFFKSQIDWNRLVSEKLLELEKFKTTEVTVIFQ